MGKKSTPAPPPAPDPARLAQEQAEANRINQYTPYGNLLYSGPNRNTATLTLSPEMQQLFDTRMGMDQAMMNEGLNRMQYLNSEPIDLSQFGPIQSNIDTSGINFQGVDLSGLPSVNSAAAWGFTPENVPQFRGDIDLSGLPGMPQDMDAYRGQVEDAYFQRSRRLLDPVMAQQQEQLQQQLANQGFSSASQGYDTEMDRFALQRGRAYEDLANSAIMMGGQEASRLLADTLATRQQGLGEQLSQAQLYNDALGQGLGARFSMMGAEQQDRARAMGELMGAAGFNNQTALQNLGLQQQLMQNQNAARLQGLNEYLGVRGNQYNELASLLGLQQVQPAQMQGFFGPGMVDVLGAHQMGLNQQNLGWQAQMQNQQNLMGGLFGLGSALLGAGGAAKGFGNLFS